MEDRSAVPIQVRFQDFSPWNHAAVSGPAERFISLLWRSGWVIKWKQGVKTDRAVKTACEGNGNTRSKWNAERNAGLATERGEWLTWHIQNME
jgi:hypothetical protein